VLLHILLQWHSGHARHDVTEEEEVDVAVDEALAGRRGRDFLDRQIDGGVVALPRVKIDVRPQSRNVRQEMANRDAALAIPIESRHQRRHWIVEPEPARFDQLHYRGRRGHHLGQRREIEDRIDGHRLDRGNDGAPAVRFLEQNAIAATHQHHGSRRRTGLHGVVHHPIDSGKARAINRLPGRSLRA
jgi:hypothetical protein